jgi:ferredoxin-fold anticodon binding domain-containing protein
MSSEQELLSQLEQLRKKQKDMESTKVSIEFKKQKDYLINKLKTFLDIDVKDNEIIAIYNDDNYLENHFNYYFKVEDEDNNLLFRRRIYNRHAQKNFIRYEDSFEIIHYFLKRIKPINDFGEYLQKNDRNGRNKRYEGERGEEVEGGNYQNMIGNYVPIFIKN